MKNEIKKQTAKKYFLAIIMPIIFLGNTIIISKKTADFYERTRDVAIILIMLLLFSYSVFYGYKEKGNYLEYFIMANIALIIIIIHLLRLSFGGLLC